MKKSSPIVMVILGLILLSCGGGGGGSGSGGGDSGSGSSSPQAIDARDYFMRDTKKVYTFSETIVASSGGQRATDDLVKTFSYEQVHTIPEKYGDFDDYPGPYRKEVVQKNGGNALIIYTDPDGEVMASDDLTTFSRIQDSDYSGDTFSSSLILGHTYASTSEETLYNSDPNAGFWGEELGFSVTTSTFKPLALENITVRGQAYTALKVQIRYTVTTTQGGQTSSTVFTGDQWFTQDIGLVKGIINYSISVESVTVQYIITDELASVSDE